MMPPGVEPFRKKPKFDDQYDKHRKIKGGKRVRNKKNIAHSTKEVRPS